MMDNRKRCDGVGALFCVLGSGGVDKIRAFSSVFVYFEGRAASCGGIRANQVAKAANSNVLFKTIQNVCLACKETGPARLGEFHR